jgi:excisionase family DNA binding protein
MNPGLLSVAEVSEYLNIKPGTLYSKIHEIPHYKIGRLIRFKKEDIDSWLEGNKKNCVAPEKVARKALGPKQKPKIDIDRVVRKAIDGTRGQGYTKPHGKPDQVKGLGREVKNGTL